MSGQLLVSKIRPLNMSRRVGASRGAFECPRGGQHAPTVRRRKDLALGAEVCRREDLAEQCQFVCARRRAGGCAHRALARRRLRRMRRPRSLVYLSCHGESRCLRETRLMDCLTGGRLCGRRRAGRRRAGRRRAGIDIHHTHAHLCGGGGGCVGGRVVGGRVLRNRVGYPSMLRKEWVDAPCTRADGRHLRREACAL